MFYGDFMDKKNNNDLDHAVVITPNYYESEDVHFPFDITKFARNSNPKPIENYKSSYEILEHEWIKPEKEIGSKDFFNSNNVPFCIFEPENMKIKKSNCSVISISTITGLDYDQAEKNIMSLKGVDEWDDKGVKINMIEKLLPTSSSLLHRTKEGITFDVKGVSLSEIISVVPLGLMTIKINNKLHSISCIDGVCYDNNYSQLFSLIVTKKSHVMAVTIPNLSAEEMESRSYVVSSHIKQLKQNGLASVSPVFTMDDSILQIDFDYMKSRAISGYVFNLSGYKIEGGKKSKDKTSYLYNENLDSNFVFFLGERQKAEKACDLLSKFLSNKTIKDSNNNEFHVTNVDLRACLQLPEYLDLTYGCTDAFINGAKNSVTIVEQNNSNSMGY